MSIDYDKLRDWLDMVDRANHQAGDTITFTYPGSTVEIVRELLRLRDGVERYRDAGKALVLANLQSWDTNGCASCTPLANLSDITNRLTDLLEGGTE